MIPALDMSKVHAERSSLAREDQHSSRATTAIVTATSNNTSYTPITGSSLTPGRTLPLRNHPAGTSSQLQQSARPSSSSVTPQTSPRGPLASDRLVRRAQEVEPYLNMNPLACTDVRTLQRALIATAETMMRMSREHREEERRRAELYEHRLATVTAFLTQSPSLSMATSPSHKSSTATFNNNNTSSSAHNTSAASLSENMSTNVSGDKGSATAFGLSGRSAGRRYPSATTTLGGSTSGSLAASPQRSGAQSSGHPNSASSGNYSSVWGPLMERSAVTAAPASGRRQARQDGARRTPVPAAAVTSSASAPTPVARPATADSASLAMTYTSTSESVAAASARPRLDAGQHQDSPRHARDTVRRGSMPSYAFSGGNTSYQNLGEGLGFSNRAAGSSDRHTLSAHVQRGPSGNRGAAVVSTRQERLAVGSGRKTGPQSARGPRGV